LGASKIGSGGNSDEVTSHVATEADKVYTKHLCLQQGIYEFKIFDSSLKKNGICRSNGFRHYSVTSKATVIAEGGSFPSKKRTRFYILG